MITGPYAHSAWDYWRMGWRGVIPLPAGRKGPPPDGYTGAHGQWVSGADIQAWTDGPEGGGNIGLRLPPDVIGFDVDDYEGKAGMQTLDGLTRHYGPLPEGPKSGAREKGGISYFRVPPGMQWPGILGAGIEVIQTRHRYAVVWPSVHPDGMTYRWSGDVIPRPEDMPALPDSWIGGITGGHLAKDVAKVDATAGDILQWLDRQRDETPCRAVVSAHDSACRRLQERQGSRHDVMVQGTMHLARLGTEGHTGIRTALTDLRRVWMSVSTQPPGARRQSAADAEWTRALRGAVSVALAVPERSWLTDPCRDPLSGILKPEDAAAGPVDVRVAQGQGSGGPEAHRGAEAPGRRRVVLRPASEIRPRKAFWLWDQRIALGTLALLAGREGLGKSTVGLWIASAITRGQLPGAFRGEPRSVIISATEDSWAHTLVPRLMVARADLSLIHRVTVEDHEGLEQSLMLPIDLDEIERSALGVGAAMWLMDPLMSRLATNLDTHRDGDVRRALEPLTALADRTNMGLLGLIHFNKSGGADPINIVMGSRAFTAVARSVLTVIPHTGDDTEKQRVLALAKSNLGPLDIPSQLFEIKSEEIPTVDGPTTTGRVEWLGVIDASASELMEISGGDAEDRSTTREAKVWLIDFLESHGGEASRGDVWKAAKAEGFSESTLRRARKLAGVHSRSLKGVFPHTTVWTIMENPSRARGGPSSTELIDIIPGHTNGSDNDQGLPKRSIRSVSSGPPGARAIPEPFADCKCSNRAYGIHGEGCRYA